MDSSLDYMLRRVGNQDVLVPLGAKVAEGNVVIVLNATARRLWDLLGEGRSAEQLALDLVEQYDIDAARARADVQAFLNELGAAGGGGAAEHGAAESEYFELMSGMLKQAGTTRQPAHAAFELTHRCNLSCRMCYARRSAADVDCATQELPASVWLDLARQGRDAGMVFLILTGGEIFVRRDFFEIYEPLTRMGLVTVLFTNATRITKGVAARLAQAPPSRMEITLYGATADTFEDVTGSPDGYEKCCAGIEALMAHGIPLSLKTTLTRQNVDEVDAMRKMADNWGLPFAASWLLSGRPDGAKSEVEDCRLPVDQCVALEAANRATATEETEGALRDIPDNFRPGAFYCHAGRSSFVIGPEGQMGVCQLLPQPEARPLEIGFAEAWKQAQHYVDAAPRTESECTHCDMLEYCLRCPAWSVMDTGKLTEPVPYLCDIAKARKARFGAS